MTNTLSKSIELPLEEQFRENWGWEDSHECYQLDRDFVDMDYYESMDDEEFINLVRKMENFLRERGISDCFIRNYGLADQAFREREWERI